MSSTVLAATVLARDGGPKGGGGLLFLLLVAALIGVAIYFFRRRRQGEPSGDAGSLPPMAPSRGGALALLDERFAKGEVDQAEYLSRRAVLTSDPGSGPPPVEDDE